MNEGRKKPTFIAVLFVFLLSFLSLINITHAKEEINEKYLQENPFYEAEVQEKKLNLIGLFGNRIKYIQKGFEGAGLSKCGARYAELFRDFKIKLLKPDPSTIEVGLDNEIIWMMFKKGDEVEVKKDLVWKDEKPLDAYKFIIEKKGYEYEFIVPLIGGNVSLFTEKKIQHTSRRTSTAPEAELEDNIIASLGFDRQVNSPEVFFLTAKLGYMQEVAKNVSVTVTAGVGYAIYWEDGIEDKENYDVKMALLGEATVNFGSPKFSFGIGGGIFHTNEKTSIDMILGMDIWLGSDLFLFIETRIDMDKFELGSFHKRLAVGLRFDF